MDVISAAVLLRHGDRYLFQRKDQGYPVEAFRGHLCFVGGSWTETGDRTPRDTALRELHEEVAPAPTSPQLAFLGAFTLWVPECRTRTRDYQILNFIYALDLDADGHELLEGDAAWRALPAARRERWCWGYDHVLGHCAEHLGVAWGVTPDPAVRCEPTQVSGDTAYADMDLSALRLNPLRDGDLDEAAPLR